nr:MAG TPA: hypothetical protein [Caudoviricetes sp.]
MEVKQRIRKMSIALNVDLHTSQILYCFAITKNGGIK